MHPAYGFGPAHSLIYFMFLGFFGAVFSLIVVIPYWFIFKKAGFSPFRPADVGASHQLHHVVLSGLRALECSSRGAVYPRAARSLSAAGMI